MSAAESSPLPGGRMVRNAFHLGVGQVATTALTVVTSASIARTLGAADFGLLYLLTSIATFAYVFVDWGHGPYIIREVARRPDRAGELLGSVLAVRAATSLVVCGAAASIMWLLGYNLRTRALSATMIVAWLPVYLALSFSWVFRGRERMDCDAAINVVLKLSLLILSLICLALGGRLLAVILVWAAGGAITFVVATIIYRRLQLPPLRVVRATARELIHDGAPLLTIGLVISVQPYIDANILYKLAPAGVMGWYAAASNIAGTLIAPASILATTAYPSLSRAAHDEAAFKRALHAVFRPLLIIAVLGAVGTFLFADLAVSIVYSKQKFGPAGTILRAYAPALLLIYIDMLLGHAILAAGKTMQLARAKFVAVFVTTSLELVLIPWCQAHLGNGAIGLTLSMAIGEVTMVVTAFLLLRHAALDGRLIADLLRAAAAGAGTLLLMRTIPPLTPFIGIPLCILAFAAAASALGLLNRADAELLYSMVRRRRENDPSKA